MAQWVRILPFNKLNQVNTICNIIVYALCKKQLCNVLPLQPH